MSNQVFGFFMPAQNYIGVGAVKQVGELINQLNARNVLVVTGEVIYKLGVAEQVGEIIRQAGAHVTYFSGVDPNPTDLNVAAGVELCLQESCDTIVAVGGGSSLDCAKAIALVASNGGTIQDYEGIDRSKKPVLPLITINTTAGTASEMTRISVITDTSRLHKMVIVDKHITPAISINDPELTIPLSAELTAGTGMDALTHAIEAYVSPLANPVTDACALQAIRLIGENLPSAVQNGQNIEARSNMMQAQFLAGMAFNNALLGYVHAIAHQLGGLYNLPHGLCNAILLPHVCSFNLDAKPERYAQIAIALGQDVAGLSTIEAAQKAVEAIQSLAQTVGIPAGLSAIGVKESEIPKLAELAMKDPCALFNPKQATLDDVIGMVTSAM
ncbi:iron-containing alcohol dehydrogenase [Brevibacillus sp. SYSU BS000544]|uniref:iron-containing alcohol dehydrogenase n=1 Tax=Brevibacillus sp. SYSU BS000544 TaxID=3416443 RepID=UPI003CE46741